MAKKKYKIKPKQTAGSGTEPKSSRPQPKRAGIIKFPFTRKNYIIFAVALGVILLGFFALIIGDITFAPILLVVGYCVLIPIAIIYNGKKKKAEQKQAGISGD